MGGRVGGGLGQLTKKRATDRRNCLLRGASHRLVAIIELPQAMGLYIATNIASSVTLTNYSKAQLAAKIPGRCRSHGAAPFRTSLQLSLTGK